MANLAKRADPRCPICGAAPSAALKPFCGPACRDRDLLQWLGEGYRIAGPAMDGGESEPGIG